MNETIGVLTLVAYRNKGTYGNVSLVFYAQNLEAQQGLDYNTSETVSYTFLDSTLYNTLSSMNNQKLLLESNWTCFRFLKTFSFHPKLLSSKADELKKPFGRI